jgi:hypothetical protein
METGKTGKYFKYAIGEIVLVVIGILIALQINNWNENRKERLKEKAYLERLKADITIDSRMLNLNDGFYKDVFDYGNLALLFAEGERIDSESNWNVLVSFFHASQIWPIITTSSTFEELKSSGELSLIRNIKLRNTLSFYHGGGLERYNQTMGINPPYRKMVRGLIPSKVQNYMWDNCHITDGDIQILQKCKPFIEEAKAIELLKELSENSRLIEELRFYMSSIKVGMATVTEQQRLCQNMLAEIEKELNTYD